MSNQFWADIIRTAMGFLDRLASDYEAKLEAEKTAAPLPTGQKGPVVPVVTPDPAQAQAQAQAQAALPLALAEGETAFNSMFRPGVY